MGGNEYEQYFEEGVNSLDGSNRVHVDTERLHINADRYGRPLGVIQKDR